MACFAQQEALLESPAAGFLIFLGNSNAAYCCHDQPGSCVARKTAVLLTVATTSRVLVLLGKQQCCLLLPPSAGSLCC
ncbi:hypothetical protein RRG08_059383 [Elysia crispata]|uniref:Uncharacterized protein n=1 Tax=Elysia crispata TaxID=231223 RepID=A0AAE1AY02_9GAST|nr:hypothetical protein RRG08_059383 [Elysia crispata]